MSDGANVEVTLTVQNNSEVEMGDVVDGYAADQAREYKEKAGDYGFEIVDIGVTAQSEVTQATDTLIGKKVDCISNLTDNNVVGVLPSILEKTDEAGIPVYGSEVEQVKLGCVASAVNEGRRALHLPKQPGDKERQRMNIPKVRGRIRVRGGL